MSQYGPMFDLKINVGHCDLFLMFALKNILVLLAKHDSGKLRCPATALIIVISHTPTMKTKQKKNKHQQYVVFTSSSRKIIIPIINYTILYHIHILFTVNTTCQVCYETPQSSVIINLSQIDYNIVLDNKNLLLCPVHI